MDKERVGYIGIKSKGSHSRKRVVFCARTGRAGQAHIDLLVPSTIRFLELPQAQTKPQSEYEANTEQAS